MRRAWRERALALEVRIIDYDVIEAMPKLGQKILQYVIVAVDVFDHAEVFYVDKDKYDRKKFAELVKQKFAARYRIPVDQVSVVFVAEPR